MRSGRFLLLLERTPMNLRVHGGAVAEAARRLGIDPADIIDFSSNINPRGLPPGAARRLACEASNPNLLTRYPDPEACELRQILSRKLNVPGESLVFGNGAAALIMATVLAFRPQSCLIPTPGFAEYQRACRAAGCEIVPSDGQRAVLRILNNPHNPTGSAMEAATVRRIIEAAHDQETAVLIDEAFIDYLPEETVAPEAANGEGVVVIRSLTKFYGCPALRAGYAVAGPETARRIAALLPAWPVGTLALNALAEALRDEEYERTSREECRANRTALSVALAAAGMRVFPSKANFLLLELPENRISSAELEERLLRDHRILVRNCDSFEGLERGRYIRVAVKEEADNRRLVQSIETIIEEVHGARPKSGIDARAHTAD
jgi:threonine-phosphate decarboxylase